MLDVDQEFDQGFDQNSAPRAARAGEAAGPAAPSHIGVGESPASQEPGADVRNLAESAYQRIANEILESTRQVCQRLIADGEKALERAKFLETEAEQKRQEVQRELDSAKALRADAETYREKSLAAVGEAQQQAQEILSRARAVTDSQLSEVKQHAASEAEKLIAEAQAMRDAAREEMEAQKLYTEAARLKAESHDALAQLRQQMGGLLSSTGNHGGQDQEASSLGQRLDTRPSAEPLPRSTAVAPVLDSDLDESGVYSEEALDQPGSGEESALGGPPEAAQQKPPEEDAALSRKKAGRWFGLAG